MVLTLIVTAALMLRLAAAWRAPLIESDGAFHAGLAAAILRGDWRHGLSPIWPPLEPVMIAAVAGLGGTFGLLPTPAGLEVAARAISVLSGTLLLFPLHRLTRRLGGEATATIAVLLAAFHPRLIQYSGAALTEMPFSLLVVTGIAALAAADQDGGTPTISPSAPPPRNLGLQLAAGASLGLAYLIRPEGLVLAGILWLGWCFFHRRDRGSRRWAPGFLVGVLLIASPYMLAMTRQLGYPSMGLKGSYNFWRDNKSEYARIYPTPRILTERASESEELAAPQPPESPHIAGFVWHRPGAVFGKLVHHFTVIVVSSIPGAVYYVYSAFVVVGVIGRPRRSWWTVGLPLTALPFLYAPFSVDRRFFVPAIPLFMIFAAGGIETVGAWIRKRSLLGASLWGRAIPGVAMLFGLLYPWAGGGNLDDAPEHRAAGEWLGSHWKGLAMAHPTGDSMHPRPVVMARKPWVAYYSGGLIAELPEGGVAAVLERALRKRADILVIDQRWIRSTRPDLIPLLDPAHAPPGLRVLHRIDVPERILLYDLRGVRVREGR